MKIKKFRIRNFRSIIDTGEVSLDRKITLLLGKNEQGKTNILKGLESFDREYRYSEDDLSYLVDIDKSPHEIPIITLWFELEEEDKKVLASISENFKDLDELMITKYFDGHYEVEKPNLKELGDIKPIVESILNILRDNQETIDRAVRLLDRVDKQKHVNWIKSLQRPDGGFSHAPGQPSNPFSTYFAVKTLIELGASDQIDRDKIIQFILSTEHPNGGFASTPGQQPDIINTTYAIKLLKELKALNKIDKQKHISWIKSLQRPDGGFSNVPNQTSHMSYTYHAVEALIDLNALDQIDKNKAIQFIISAEHPNGGFGHLPNQQPQLAHTCQAIILLKVLGGLSRIDLNKHISWIKSLQMPDGGFWSGIGAQRSDINLTYLAVKVLMEFNMLDNIDMKKLIEFILSLQHINGGFIQASGTQPHPQPTYYAIRLLKDLQYKLTEQLNQYIQELEKTSDPVKVYELLDAILDVLKNSPENIPELTTLIEREKNRLKEYGNYSNILEKVLELIPSFVYFDSVDIIEDSISLDEYLRNKDKYKTFTNLFRLANLDVEKVRNISDPFKKKRLFRDASACITGMINEFWEQERVNVNLDIDGDQILVFVEDYAGARADPPSKRSDGFRWFLSFYINFMAGTKGELRNAVLLLDNPGWVLHPSGQKSLLKILEKIAETNQIIIATHSPFLIDKNKLERIRIVERRPGEGTKVYEKFWDSMYDSLATIRAAIGVDLSDSLFGHKNNIIVEGYSDKVYLEAMAEYLKKKRKESIDLDKVMIIGAGGADKIPYLLKWFKAEKYNVLAILDFDNEGRRAKSEIESKHKEIDVDKEVLMLNEISEEFKSRDVEIEDLFDEEFYNLAVNKAYREIFEHKLGKPGIKVEELPSDGLTTKRYGRFFKSNDLGGFDKIKVALEIKKILSEDVSEDIENMLKKAIENFENLFAKIKEKFKDRANL